jgi:molybdate transport system substrate-binding protein
VLGAINTLYTQANPNVTITPNFASSGTLETDIINGAPADVFISANAADMNTLQQKNLLVNSSVQNLLNNTLVLIVPANSTLGITSFNNLTNANVTKIGMTNPSSDPEGAYAVDVFNELGINSQVQSKEVLEASADSVLTDVETGNVDAGIVYATVAKGDSKVTVVANAPADVNAQIVYPEAVVQASKNQTAAQAYLNFLSTPQAVAVWQQYGFTMASK